MPTIADYIVIHQGTFTLPGGGSSDRHFQINPPAASIGSPAVLEFRVNPNDDVTLQVRVNNTNVVRQPFNTEPQRSWHAVVPPNTLRASGNEVVFSVLTGSPGNAEVSDIVLFFQANIT